MNLSDYTTNQLVNELKARAGVRDMDIEKDEGYRITGANINGRHERYLKGNGRVKIIEVKI